MPRKTKQLNIDDKDFINTNGGLHGFQSSALVQLF